MKLAIAIPTYNEATNIKKLLPAIQKNLKGYPELRCTVFVIDDSSPDGTANAAEILGRKLKTRTFSVSVLSRKKKEGLGKAYVYAFHKILAQKFDYILQMDADLSHNPKYLPKFLDAANEADFVVGSRYVRGGATPDWTWFRKLQSRGGNIYSRLLLSSRITDYTGGFNLYSADLLQAIDLDSLQAGTYGFLIELKYNALLKCQNVRQVPIVFLDRQHGNSKLPQGSISKNLTLVLRLKFSVANKDAG
jgi:dolichol-phosphate mannosyltransferase